MKISKSVFSLDLIDVDTYDFSQNPETLISPEGHVYLVDYMAHESMAHKIIDALYPQDVVPYNELYETHLLKKGWLKTSRPYYMHSDGCWCYSAVTEPCALHLITDEQLRVVGEFDRRALRNLMDDIQCERWVNCHGCE